MAELTPPQIEAAARHNDLVKPAISAIIKPMRALGASPIEILILLESVIVGVIFFCAKIGGDEIVLETVFERVRDRLATVRLTDIEPEGEA